MDKIARAMQAKPKWKKSQVIRQAIELGLDVLEIQGYDANRALAQAITVKPDHLQPFPNLTPMETPSKVASPVTTYKVSRKT